MPDAAAKLIPVPDPSELTTAQADKGLRCLREVVEAELDGIRVQIEAVKKNADQRPSEIDLRVDHLKSLHDEKFKSIETQFRERDTRTEQTQKDSKVAVDAALQAAKEAVGEQNKSSALAIAKSEAATTKQIDQILTIIQATTGGTNDKIDDIKSRLTLIEGHSRGASDGVGWIIGGIGALVGIGSLIVLFMSRPAATVAPVAAPQVIYVPAPAAAAQPHQP
jgi:hypothetical protein